MGGLGIDLASVTTVPSPPPKTASSSTSRRSCWFARRTRIAHSRSVRMRVIWSVAPPSASPGSPDARRRDRGSGVGPHLRHGRRQTGCPHRSYGLRPKGVISVPAAPLERRAVLEVGHEAGLRKVGLVPEPVAGALGCGINPLEARCPRRGHRRRHFGSHRDLFRRHPLPSQLPTRRRRTDQRAVPVPARGAQDRRRRAHRRAGEGGHPQAPDGQALVVEGRDAVTGRARLVETEEIVDALRPTTAGIVQTLTDCLEDLPAQAIGDVMSEGLLTIGGGAMLRSQCGCQRRPSGSR